MNYQLIQFDKLASSNDYLKDNYEHLDDFTICRCNYQTEGRGRNKRQWLAAKNENLLFSLLLLNKEIISKYKAISIVTAYSVLKVLEKYDLKGLAIKWPNDVYVVDEKICGILLEAISNNELQCLIVGVGLNVNQTEFAVDNNPTSVSKVLKKQIDINSFQYEIYDCLVNNINKLKDGHDFYEEIKAYDYLKGKKAYANIDNEVKNVTVIGINEDYSLKVSHDGKQYDVETGEISFHID
ncbi:MAG: biotin--[acetyl-CoA-carboxylase] ligase [Erysipelotrichaceae bacterium]|nr:biotin--[acetyl-CoA-carboxylase] ligase [Erysipelotrichaceae bacterium]